jgi:hypothetical protein
MLCCMQTILIFLWEIFKISKKITFCPGHHTFFFFFVTVATRDNVFCTQLEPCKKKFVCVPDISARAHHSHTGGVHTHSQYSRRHRVRGGLPVALWVGGALMRGKATAVCVCREPHGVRSGGTVCGQRKL